MFSVIYSQTNLVNNPGYETYSSCPAWPGAIANATGWNNPVGINSSTDYFNSCMLTNTGANLYNSTFGPHSGNGFVRIGETVIPSYNFNYQEYLQVSLTQPLVAGNSYKVSFYAGIDTMSSCYGELLGVYISDNSVTTTTFPSNNSMQGAVVSTVPQFNVSNGGNWQYYEAVFTAVGGETMMTMGNFVLNANIQNLTYTAYYGGFSCMSIIYIDDVELIEFDPCTFDVSNSVNGQSDTVRPCLGDTVTITGIASDTAYVPSWNNGAFSAQSFTTDTSGVYIGVFNINGCNETDTLVVDFVTPLVPTVVDTSICMGDSLILINPDLAFDASIEYGGNVLYQGDTIYTTASGNQEYVLEQGDCRSSAFFQLDFDSLPTVTVPLDTFVCEFFSFQVTGSVANADSYIWNTGNDSLTMTVPDTGIYILEATNNCGVSADTMIVGWSEINYTLNVSGDTLVCNGQPFQATVQGTGLSAIWNNTTASLTQALTEGTWTVEITDGFCTEYDTITVSYPNSFSFGFTDTTLCDDANLQLTANATWVDSLQWSDGSTASTFSTNVPGSYWVNLFEDECIISDSIALIMEYAPIINFNDTSLCLGQSFPLSMNSSYNYQLNGNNIQAPYFIENGNYFEVIATNNCGSDVSTFEVEQVDCTCNIYIPNTFTPNGDESNPNWNPSTACVFSEYELTVYNRWGELIFRTNEPDFGWDGTYNGEIVKEGTYVYTLFYTILDTELGGSINGHVNVIK